MTRCRHKGCRIPLNRAKTRLCCERFIHYNPSVERPAYSGLMMERAVTNPRNTQVVIGPNASMTQRMAVTFMVIMAVVSLLIAGGFAAIGLWPILPFAGLELGALGLALQVSLRRNRYREVISFADRQVRVECGMAGEGARLVTEWPRSSTRVLLEAGINRNDPTKLVLSNGGRRLILGRCLTDEDRERLAARLRELVLAGWSATPQDAAESESPNGI